METINNILGIHEEELSAIQMICRAVIVFILGFVFVRIAGLRTFGGKSNFDQLTVLMLGAILGRAIVTTQPFWESMSASIVLMLLHRFVGWLTYKSHDVGIIIKGEPLQLIKNGELLEKNMEKGHISREDLYQSLRLEGHTTDVEDVWESFLERSGEISIVKKNQERDK